MMEYERPAFISPSTPRMDSRMLEVKRPAVIIPRIPQDVIHEILDHLVDSDLRSLQACALVSKSWIPSCRRHIFHTVDLTSGMMDRWFDTFPVPEESPAHHVRGLRVSFEGVDWFPDKFFEHAPQFTNVQGLFLLQGSCCPVARLPSLWRLPESVTSLTIGAGGVGLVEIWDIMARLPNLDNFSLYGSYIPADRRELLGTGTVPKGRFTGKLLLYGTQHASGDVTNMLLEIPTGLHFTHVVISCAPRCLPSVIRLVEACCKTIVKLSLEIDFYGKPDPFSSSG